MKNRIVEIAAFILTALTTCAGVFTLPQVALLPEKWQPYIALALAAVLLGKNGVYLILDFADDGLLNKSYKLPPNLPILLLLGLCLGLVSCANDRFLGVTKAGWGDILKDVGKGALQGAVQSSLPAYQRVREETSAKGVIAVQP